MAVDPVSVSWDAEYRRGRYQEDPPVPFVADILAAARGLAALRSGLYIGCGNGRNYLPLRREGLPLIGLDVSAVAIDQLAARAPQFAADLVVGSLRALPAGARYDLVVGIQVFQHGTRDQAHDHVRAALERVSAGGLIAIRVNATGTQIEHRHEVVDSAAEGLTVHYLEGPKAGLDIHFFSQPELEALVGPGFAPVLPIRHTTHRRSGTGTWSQWEGIWASCG